MCWIGIRAAHQAPMRALPEVELLTSLGPRGDYTALGRGGGSGS